MLLACPVLPRGPACWLLAGEQHCPRACWCVGVSLQTWEGTRECSGSAGDPCINGFIVQAEPGSLASSV